MPRPKSCTHPDCHSPCAREARFCALHCSKILTALRASTDYRTDDRKHGPPHMLAEAAFVQRAKADE